MPVVHLFHANGWGLAYAALMLGSRVVCNGRFTAPEDILQLACDHGVTMCAAVPTIWQVSRQELMRNPGAYEGRFRVKQIMCGGSAPPNEMMRWYWDT